MKGRHRAPGRASLAIAGILAAAVPLAWHVAARDHGGDQNAIDGLATAAIAGEPRGFGDAASALDDTALLREGLAALAAGDIAGARAARDTLPDGVLDRRILAWAIALDGGRAVTRAEIEDASKTLAGWPGQAALRRNLERALIRERADAQTVIAALAGDRPTTIEGAVALARAYREQGDTASAAAAIGTAWRSERLDRAAELSVIGEFGAIIAPADHRIRMETMLHHDRVASAERVAALAGATELCRAWAAAIRGEKNAASLLEAVPEAQRATGHAFAKARMLRKAGKLRAAAEALLAAPAGADAIEPDAWWQERRTLSRDLLDLGDAETAYRLAAAQERGSATTLADAAFHAGWFALRGLGDSDRAAAQFARIAAVAEGPISRSRAFYWLGRAAEDGAPGDAKAFYAQAAAYGATFYGQLAAHELGRETLQLGAPKPTGADAFSFSRRETVRAIDRLEAAGEQARAGLFYRALAERLAEPGEVALLAGRAEARGDHNLALRVGKIAAGRGVDVGILAHPLGAIPDDADMADAGAALAYAVARQESEFNPAAVSRAGARGLLQLLPGTARDMAKKRGIDFSAERLTADAGYNATLGAAFLAEQLARFDGSYVLAIAGYNAGPRRALDWAKRYGDPRGAELDTIVDWIERIPFTETRSYVQRVMENYQVYKMRLSGRFDIAGDLVEGR